MRANPFFLAKLILTRAGVIPPETSETEAARIFLSLAEAAKEIASGITSEFYRLEDEEKKAEKAREATMIPGTGIARETLCAAPTA